jgi:hypothetical protein
VVKYVALAQAICVTTYVIEMMAQVCSHCKDTCRSQERQRLAYLLTVGNLVNGSIW